MRYLFGDSSQSPLGTDYIGFLRDALDFAVQALEADHRASQWKRSAQARREAAEGEVRRLEELGREVAEILRGRATAARATPTRACATAIARATADLVRGHAAHLRSALADDVSRIEEEIRREREASYQALEGLLLAHNLPDTTLTLALRLEGGRPRVDLRTASRLGLQAIIEVEVPEDSPVAEPLRLDRVVERLEVHAPEETGWLRKTVKPVLQRLTKHYVTEAWLAPDGSRLALRAGTEAEAPGFDVEVDSDGDVRLVRAEPGRAPGEPYLCDGEDARALCEVRRRVSELVSPLARGRRALLRASLDDTPYREHEQPSVLVARLVGAMAPVVDAIARHSPVEGELTLKRVLADDRREELFVSKAELRDKLKPLPRMLRTTFDPLKLGGFASATLQAAQPLPGQTRAGLPSGGPPSGGPPSGGPPSGGPDAGGAAPGEGATRIGRLPRPAPRAAPSAAAGPADPDRDRGDEPDSDSSVIPIEDDWLEKVSRVEHLPGAGEDSVDELLDELELDAGRQDGEPERD